MPGPRTINLPFGPRAAASGGGNGTVVAAAAAAAVTRNGPVIAIKNQSTVVTDAQAQAVVAALQIQLDRDWYPAWNTTATLVFLNKNQAVPAGAWPLYLLDTSDVAGALGYHDETNRGVPYGRVFVKTSQQYGYSWTVTLSHELLEMVANPHVNLTVFRQSSNSAGSIYFFEVGDACEDDSFGYRINGILVSDFVFPAWFDSFQLTAGTRYDFMNRITAPFQILTGGYVSVYPVNRGNGWTTLTHRDVEVPAGTDISGRNRMDR